MKEPNSSSSKEPGRAGGKDIASVLKGWDYEPGTINVRKVNGLDGKPKLQMRLDLGLLQMEMTGRPDGAKPYGCESLLEYFTGQLAEFKEKHEGVSEGFVLTADQCQMLREESVMYYHRYLSLFVLEEFPSVVRDTGRNLRVLDLCHKFAAQEEDRLILEQYRPYITMMYSRAAASVHVKEKNYSAAIKCVEAGLERIKEFFVQFGHEEVYQEANEVKVLRRFAKEIRRKLPVDPMQRLQKRLGKAIEEERYEDAARLRDEIERMKQTTQQASDTV